jgi:hypothetical protein
LFHFDGGNQPGKPPFKVFQHGSSSISPKVWIPRAAAGNEVVGMGSQRFSNAAPVICNFNSSCVCASDDGRSLRGLQQFRQRRSHVVCARATLATSSGTRNLLFPCWVNHPDGSFAR